MKKKIFFIRILAIIALVITIFEIKNTYAIFYSQLQGTSQSNIGKWNIEINNTNISSGVNNSFIINNLSIDSNVNVKNDRLAPGTQGYFDILINPKNTNVAVRYDITIDKSNLTNSSIIFNSIEEVLDNDISLVKTGINTYTGVIPLNKINNSYSNDIKITFSWINNEENNQADSLIGFIKNNKLNVPITISVEQYLGESIIEYTGV